MKNVYHVYSSRMVATRPSGSWTKTYVRTGYQLIKVSLILQPRDQILQFREVNVVINCRSHFQHETYLHHQNYLLYIYLI
jgi:hypothetical protein